MKQSFLIICLVVFAGSCLASPPSFRTVFVADEGGYQTIRTPQVLVTQRGTLLVFAQGRDSPHDQSGNDILLKRSHDSGKSWSDLEVIARDQDHSLNSICVLQLRGSGRLLVVGCIFPKGYTVKDYRYSSKGMQGYMRRAGRDTWPAIRAGYGEGSERVYVVYSDDDGQSWSPLRDITRQTRRPEALTCVPGPGVGIQLKRGEHAGRIVIPCNQLRLEMSAKPRYENLPYAIYSDDDGTNWQIGELARPADQYPNLSANETQLVELRDGTILLNTRTSARATAQSEDGGQSWSPLTPEPQLTGPACAAGFIRYDQQRLLFSLPNGDGRSHGTIWMSRDEGRTWAISKELRPGTFGYSSLARLSGGDVVCVFGGRAPAGNSAQVGPRGVILARFSMGWLEE